MIKCNAGLREMRDVYNWTTVASRCTGILTATYTLLLTTR